MPTTAADINSFFRNVSHLFVPSVFDRAPDRLWGSANNYGTARADLIQLSEKSKSWRLYARLLSNSRPTKFMLSIDNLPSLDRRVLKRLHIAC